MARPWFEEKKRRVCCSGEENMDREGHSHSEAEKQGGRGGGRGGAEESPGERSGEQNVRPDILRNGRTVILGEIGQGFALPGWPMRGCRVCYCRMSRS
jgi:hypothetical protein